MKNILCYFLILFAAAANPQNSLKWHNIVPFIPRAILLDSYGDSLLWLAGTGGLFKYDLQANTWNSFNTAEGLSKIWGRCLFIEQQKIWVGTESRGANMFDPENEKFTPFLQLCNKGYYDEYCPSVLSIYLEGNHVWLGTLENGLYLADKTTLDTIKHFTMDDGLGGTCIYSIIDDGQFLWLATSYCGAYTDFPPPLGGISRLNKSTFEIDNFKLNGEGSSNYFYSLASIQDKLWVGGSSGLFIFDKENRTFTPVLNDGLYDVNNVFADNENIWFTGYYDYSEHLFQIDRNTYQIINSLPVSGTSVAADWNSDFLYLTMGDYEKMNLYKMKKSSFELSLIPDNFLPSPYCYGVNGDESTVYAGSGNYIVKINNREFSYQTVPEPDINVRNMTVDGEFIWVCTDNGLFKYRANESFEFLKNYFTSEIVFFIKTNDNYIWASTHLGLYRIDKSNDHTVKMDLTNELNTFGTPKISDIIFDENDIWVSFSGTENGGDLITGIIQINSLTLETERLKILPIGDYTQAFNSLENSGNYLIVNGKEIQKINKDDLSSEIFIEQQANQIIVKDNLLWAVINFDGVKVFDLNTKEEKYHIKESSGLLHNYVTDMFINNSNAYFTTYGGISILELSSLSGLTDRKEDKLLPENLELFDNYPNPFNPITAIKFSLPVSEKVQLIVYDLLGNEIATILNEEKTAGNYEVKFDGSALSSGIYFYVLRAGDKTMGKKMCLIK
jgi:hypothetical protein